MQNAPATEKVNWSAIVSRVVSRVKNLEAKRAKAGKYEKRKSLFDNVLRKRVSARKSRKTPFQT
jgi:hypothetical protein